MAITCPKCHSNNPETVKFCGECGTQFPSLEEIPDTETIEASKTELTRGTTLAKRYEIIEELGKGGMGRVYRVEDTKLEQEIALKLIKPEIARDKKTIERFRNELKLARNIRHKNVCGMFDLGEAEGAHFITMEYIRGEDLRSFIHRSGQLAISTTIRIAKQVCEGLSEAHKLGVVHRDLKSNNIMIDKEGNVRIMDFGIARSLEAKGITGAGVMIGTPEYMSPEQVEGKEVDRRSDIYSLGVILYEMVTGRVPFEGDTPFTVGMKHKGEIPQNPKEFNTQIPDDLSRVILRCLEKVKEKRCQSAGEVRSELINIEEGMSATERGIPKRKIKTEVIREFRWEKAFGYGGIAFLLAILIVGGIYLFTGRHEAINSIAVLPLANLSGDPQQEYFADGMTEALITELSKISALQRVISRTSVMQYKGVRKSMQEISRELNVDAVVEGSVMFVGERVRITAQLIHAPKDKHIWADNYERDLSDILDLQREVAEAIVQEIKVKLTPQEEAQLNTIHKINPEAYQSYLKGLFHWNKRTGEDLRTAIEYFEMAIEKEPNYALAYAGLSDCYNLLHLFADLHPSETFPKAKEAALKALEIDDNLAEAHNSLAYARIRYDFDWEGAEREFRRAIELNPNYATGHFWYSELLMQSCRFDEGLSEIKRATELDPVSLVINSTLGIFYAVAGQDEQAIAQLRKTLEMDPDFAYAHRHLGMVYLIVNKFPEAIAELEKALELSGGTAFYLASLGGAYARAGQPDKAKQILAELQSLYKELHIGPCYFAAIYAELGEEGKAFWWLEKAYEERYEDLVFLKINFHFDPIRSDPRFKALLKKVGLE